jgi:MerR family copper efflux transcriptional regulator
MEGLRVGALAESAGLAPSTVRYYERVGLLSPARRAANGYRVFDESALEELAFIGRAKGIGMTLDDIAQLVAAWPNGECRSLQARLRGFLVERIAQVHDQLDELGGFERQLQAVLGRLAARDPGPERCGKGCGCETDLDVTTEGSPSGPRAWGCSLGDAELTGRLGQWQQVVGAATSVERTGEAVRLRYPVTPAVVAELAGLCASETACCCQTRFVMEITADQVVVTMEASGTPGLLDALVGLDSPSRR